MNRPTIAAEKRICIFGGTFDPIHKAHLQIARDALRSVGLGKILFVPANHPPHKNASQMTPFEDRYRMVELACEGQANFIPSRLEAGEGNSYSIDTVERLRQELPPDTRLYFLIGADAFDEIETWHRSNDLIRAVEFIVVSRPGHRLRTPEGAVVHEIKGLSLPVSSTGIRERLAKGAPTPELPAAVRDYILANHLYGS